jgi:hypothetical protein
MLKKSLPNFRVGKVLDIGPSVLPLPLAYQPQDDTSDPEGTIFGTRVFFFVRIFVM